MITIRKLCKLYHGKVQALSDLDLDIPGVGMFGLLGINGAGKTTLMRILAGLLHPTSGQVRVLGHDLCTAPGQQAIKSLLGYLPQELGLYPDLTAPEFLDYIATLKGIRNGARRKQEIDVLLERVGLSDVPDRKLKTFSGGMKRRVGIAQALLGSPKLLIVDEPTSGLDPEERVRFRNLLADVAKRCAVILSTHIIEDIGQSCGSMAVLWQGRALFRGSPGELENRARGKVWAIQGETGPQPHEEAVIVSTRQSDQGMIYRVLSESMPGDDAIAVRPRLEDGYMWLMAQARLECTL